MGTTTETRITSTQAKDAIYKAHSISSSASEIDDSVNLAHPSLNSWLYKLNDKSRSLAIFVNSDSTGNGTDEWVYFYAQWLATNYPEYTVRYRIWNDVSNNYDTSIVLNTGANAFFIDIWNFAVAGSMPFHCLNINRKQNGIINITNNTIYTDVSATIDLCIINHSHNVNSPYLNDNPLRYALFTEEFIIAHPYCESYMMIRQNPLRDDNSNISKVNWAIDWAKKKNICIANVWDKFIALNKIPSLYADNIHPSTGLGTELSPTGTRLFLDAVTEQMDKKFNFNFVSYTSLLLDAKKSFVFNPNLYHSNGDNVAPSGFTVSGGTATKDTSVFINPEKEYSTKVMATGGTACYLEYIVSAATLNFLKNKHITCSVLIKTDSELNINTYGRVILITDGMGGDLGLVQLNGSWNWRFTTIFVKPDAVYVKIRVYVDSSSSVSAGKTINVDKIILSEGITSVGNAL